MMFGRELSCPDHLQGYPLQKEVEHNHEYFIWVEERLEQAYKEIRQLQTRQDYREEPLLLATGEMVWLENRRQRK